MHALPTHEFDASVQQPQQLRTVVQRIHDDEPETSDTVVRALLASECPQWSTVPLEYMDTSGTDNAMWRGRAVGTDIVVRLPRRPGAASGAAQEVALLQRLSASDLCSAVRVPVVLHAGQPQEVFPHRWSVLRWLDGVDAWSGSPLSDSGLRTLAFDLATAIHAIRDLGHDLPARTRTAGQRGGPILPVVHRLLELLDALGDRAKRLFDVAAARRLAAEATDVADAERTCFTHGDLLPGNVLLRNGRLSAILDWGNAGYGDPALDLTPAWSMLDGAARDEFRELMNADDDAWIRGRTNALAEAVGGVLYYVPRRHALGDVMAATLARIIASEH